MQWFYRIKKKMSLNVRFSRMLFVLGMLSSTFLYPSNNRLFTMRLLAECIVAIAVLMIDRKRKKKIPTKNHMFIKTLIAYNIAYVSANRLVTDGCLTKLNQSDILLLFISTLEYTVAFYYIISLITYLVLRQDRLNGKYSMNNESEPKFVWSKPC